MAASSDKLTTSGRLPTPRRAEVRVGSLAAFDPVLATDSDLESGAATGDVIRSACSDGSFRRPQQQVRRSASTIVADYPQLVPPRRPRAVPVRRLAARRSSPTLEFIGTAAVFASTSCANTVATVQLDLTGIKGVRAEVAFSGAAATAALSDAFRGFDTVSESEESGPRSQTVYFHGLGGGKYVQVRNPLCVPRVSDNLSTWRTCMVPIADLEEFAFMKPPRQRWYHLAQPENASPSSLVFTLMCYNILSDQYASSKSYWYCPDWALAWSYRRQGIMETIGNFLPSVLCMQEVETAQFYSFFLPSLSKRGYDGIFSPKSRAKTMDNRLRMRVDGCAIFWKKSEFRLIEQRVIELNQQYLEQCWTPHATGVAGTASNAASNAASSEIFSRIAQRDNIALAVVLTPAAVAADDPRRSPHLLVCNCHVHWDPQHPDVKLIQTLLVTGALADTVRRHGGDLPLLLCGDFNSLPGSGVIEFLSLGSVPRDHPDFCLLGEDPSLDGLQPAVVAADGTVAGEPPRPGQRRQADRFSHELRLQSCYSGVDTGFTNYTHDFKGIIDYIFASRDHFRVLDCLEGLSDWLRSESVIGCPNPYIPSDHIPLMVRLQMMLPPAF